MMRLMQSNLPRNEGLIHYSCAVPRLTDFSTTASEVSVKHAERDAVLDLLQHPGTDSSGGSCFS